MTEKKFKLIQWLLYGLMAISAIFTVLFYFNPSSPDILLYWGYALVIFSGVVVLTVSITGMLKNPKGSYKVLLIVVGIVVLGILSYALSSNTLSPIELEKYSITAKGVKMVGAGLLMTYFIGIIAIGVFLYTAFSRFIK
jgi:NADH:ubiquinone oxidoreductase subunit 6 (subunit J)